MCSRKCITYIFEHTQKKSSSINGVLCHESFITFFFVKCQNVKRVAEVIKRNYCVT